MACIFQTMRLERRFTSFVDITVIGRLFYAEPIAPEPPVTARADPRSFYRL